MIAKAASEKLATRSGSGLGGVVRRLTSFEASSVVLALLTLFLVVGLLRPSFWSASQQIDIVRGAVATALLASGVSYLIAMQEIDLSVGSNMGLCVVMAAIGIRDGWPWWLAILAALATGVVVGLMNATIVQRTKVHSLIVTLATLSMIRGFALGITNARPIVGLDLSNPLFVLGERIAGIPISVFIALLLVVVLTAVMKWTPFGMRVRSIGSNPQAAELAGIPRNRVRLQAFGLAGLMAGVAGVLAVAFFTTGDASLANGTELIAIASAVIGGAPLSGGHASIPGAAVGAVLLSMVTSALVYFNIPINWALFVTGAVILAAVSLDALARSRRAHREVREVAALATEDPDEAIGLVDLGLDSQPEKGTT